MPKSERRKSASYADSNEPKNKDKNRLSVGNLSSLDVAEEQLMSDFERVEALLCETQSERNEKYYTARGAKPRYNFLSKF